MNIIAIDSAYIRSRLNSLAPHSRLRPGYCDLLRQIRTQELEAEKLAQDLVSALEAELSDLTRSDHERIRESW